MEQKRNCLSLCKCEVTLGLGRWFSSGITLPIYFKAYSRTVMSVQGRRGNARLPPEVNRVLYVRNLPFKISSEELYDIFGKYGAIRQIRLGVNNDTRGTAFVVYEDIYDAKNAVDHLSGFNVCGRYLIVLYYQANKMQQRKGAVDINKQKKELQDLKDKYGVE
ncbi:pre-mRNA branch site protein p14, putative [Phytophthora infestans T30-4]|uniref:Pre-mRNA branch site protein p14, putative n=2 Tax=Phytophthora infestans TaxID=4787 RepID=D0NEY7_PHYIT|nr:pre-mRNA branch site protein p14, putative [Phytophthora infestans T30-4]EEY56776.1 pre-mRNA branch site protein p14, putative [Phytophthora infestans T30-4]|eukprot:XP_002902104.1 pre-mRNA branch site protein p14, putative [Phytophthora infestans T30-4]